MNPYFSASKIRFILDHLKDGQKRAEKGELLFGTIDSWLIYKMSKGEKHGKLNKIYTGLRANLVVGDSATIKSRYALTRPYVGLILQILNELDEGLQSFKRYYRSFDFADIASLARQAAKIPEINAELKARYRYIMDAFDDDRLGRSELQVAAFGALTRSKVELG